jgi:hypothetical protein
MEGPVGPPRVTKPWLRPGSEIEGVRLSSAQQLNMTLRGRTWNGIELVYGSGGSPFTAPLVVDEMEHPDSPSQWWSIPRGFIRIDEAAEPSPGHRLLWIGQLVRKGTYVTIRTRISRAAVLEAARLLRPA